MSAPVIQRSVCSVDGREPTPAEVAEMNERDVV